MFASIETGFSRRWGQAGQRSNNAGAVQSGRPPCNPSTSFIYTDTHPNPDGTSTPYSICFKKYPTLVDGVADVARIMYREIRVGAEYRRPALDAAMIGDLYGVSAGMRAQGYYEGFGRTQAERIGNHHRALENAVRVVAIALGEPMPGGKIIPRPTLRRASQGEHVKDWQRFLNEELPGEKPLVVRWPIRAADRRAHHHLAARPPAAPGRYRGSQDLGAGRRGLGRHASRHPGGERWLTCETSGLTRTPRLEC